MYVPKNKELKVEIIQLHYNILAARYGERQKIIGLVVAKNDKGYKKTCRQIWYVLKNKKPYRNTGRKTDGK